MSQTIIKRISYISNNRDTINIENIYNYLTKYNVITKYDVYKNYRNNNKGTWYKHVRKEECKIKSINKMHTNTHA